MSQTETASTSPVRTAIEIAINLLLIFGILAWCFRIVSPFISLIVWGAVIAVAVYKPFLSLRSALGGRKKLAMTVFIVLGLGAIALPTWMFAGSLIDGALQIRTSLETGHFLIPPANESVRAWPLIGDTVYTNWSQAATNLEGWLKIHHQQIQAIASGALSQAAGVGLSVLQFIISVLIAATMLAHADKTTPMIGRLCCRLAGERGTEMLGLSVATIRSVAVGVMGIAFIQAVLGGAGMMLVGIPAAGVWTLIILVLAIAQLPPWLVLLPAMIYVFSTNDSTTVAVMFSIWSIVVSFLDAVLKPLLLGKGVDAPMLVILLGAIGGMLYSGIIGLFLGAVVLVLGYTLFKAWLVYEEDPEPEAT